MKDRVFWAAFAVLSAALLAAAATHRAPMSVTEVWGFVTGAACVWLTVRENVWNWPIGIANDVFFVALFLRARLFADMSLQVVYIVLGFLGWYWWLYGGENRSELRVARTEARTAVVIAALVIAGTVGMNVFLTHIHDSAPLWDALTTMLSLAAQYLLTRKLLENWSVWMAADAIYIVLYATRHLYLTSVLYVVFLAMCVLGWREWRRAGASTPPARLAEPAGV